MFTRFAGLEADLEAVGTGEERGERRGTWQGVR